MRHLTLPTAVLAMLLAFSLVSAVPAGAQDGPAIVVAGGAFYMGPCHGGVSLLWVVGCAIYLPCWNGLVNLYRVGAEIALPSGPATLVVQAGFSCADIYEFPEGSCTGGLHLDITCEGDAGMMFLGADGTLRWKAPNWRVTEGGCCITRSDVSADVLPVPG